MKPGIRSLENIAWILLALTMEDLIGFIGKPYGIGPWLLLRARLLLLLPLLTLWSRCICSLSRCLWIGVDTGAIAMNKPGRIPAACCLHPSTGAVDMASDQVCVMAEVGNAVEK